MVNTVRILALRLLLCPVFVVLFALGGRIGYAWALGVAVGLEVAGFVTRYSGAAGEGEPTALGALFQALVDMITRLTVYVCLLEAGYAPLWVAVVAFYADSIAIYLRVAAAHVATAAGEGAAVPWGRDVLGQVRAFAHTLVVWAIFWVLLRAELRDEVTRDATRRTCHALMTLLGIVTAGWAADRIVRSRLVLRSLLGQKQGA